MKLPRVDGWRYSGGDQRGSRTAHIAESYRLGVNSDIVKPVDFEEFTDVIREMAMCWHQINQPPQERS